MKKLSDILSGYKYTLLQGDEDVEVNSISENSLYTGCNDIFVAIRGEKADGHKYINGAVNKGASVIVCEQLNQLVDKDVTIVKVSDTRDALSWLAASWYAKPSVNMKVIGVTGTNGKTTVASMLYHVFRELGYPCGLFSTVEIIINDNIQQTTHTTPGPLKIQETMAQMRDAGCEYCFMEVSSHALVQKRVNYIDFSSGIFTNITQDHLDYHKTFKEYIKAKQIFFDQLSSRATAIYNFDDRNGRFMVQNTAAEKVSYSLKKPSDFKAKILKKEIDGMLMQIGHVQMWTMLTGQFNAYNIMAVYAAATCFYDDNQELLKVISKQKAVRGRFEHLTSESGIHAIIDYAHTPDAVENVLMTIQEVRTGNEQVIVVIGAGGNRDKTKRPLMAEKACKYVDTVFFTSDNPRFEEPGAIIQDMKQGIPAVFTGREFTIENREEAIKVACGLARSGDIVVVAGKGHETYQEIGGVRHYFDDRAIMQKYLK